MKDTHQEEPICQAHQAIANLYYGHLKKGFLSRLIAFFVVEQPNLGERKHDVLEVKIIGIKETALKIYAKNELIVGLIL